MSKSTKQFIVKYNPHTGQHGIYDTDSRSIRWCADKAEAASAVVRANAHVELLYNLDSAIANTGTILTGGLTPAGREHFEQLRSAIRTIKLNHLGIRPKEVHP